MNVGRQENGPKDGDDAESLAYTLSFLLEIIAIFSAL